MVHDGFTVQPAQLRESGGGMVTAGNGLDGRNGLLSGDASIWGADEEGSAFGGAYGEVAAEAQKALTSLVTEFASISDRLTAMADDYDGTEDNTVSTMRSLGQVG